MNTVTEHDATLDRPEAEDLAKQATAVVPEKPEHAADANNATENLLSFMTHDGVALNTVTGPQKRLMKTCVKPW